MPVNEPDSVTRCPYCETPYSEAISPDDCCHGAEAAALRREVERLREALEGIACGSDMLGMRLHARAALNAS